MPPDPSRDTVDLMIGYNLQCLSLVMKTPDEQGMSDADAFYQMEWYSNTALMKTFQDSSGTGQNASHTRRQLDLVPKSLCWVLISP